MTACKRIPRYMAIAAMVLFFGQAGQGGQAFAQAKVQAGVSAAVQGQIQIASLGAGVGQIAKSGEDIFLGDSISSGENAGMQVLLLDETVFTIGAQSAITIDEFIYDPATGDGTVTAQVVKGAFRFVTGRIARQKPRAMAVKLPIGAIGVRGTIVAGRVDGESSLVVLLGPGANTDTEERLGRILVSNAGETVEISRAGFATRIDGVGVAPIEPFQLPAAELRALTASFEQDASSLVDKGGDGTKSKDGRKQSQSGGQRQQQGQNADQRGQNTAQQQHNANQNKANQQNQNAPAAPSTPQASGGNAGTLAGEGQVAANQNANNQINTAGAAKDGDKLLNDATQGDPLNQLPPVTAGVATFEEIRRLRTGVHTYEIDAPFLQTRLGGDESNIQGKMKFRLDFDFGARTLGGGGSTLNLDTTKNGGNIDLVSPIEKRSYLNDTGPAVKVLDRNGVDPPEVDGSRIEVRNANGIIAQTVRADIVYKDNFGNQGSGSGESGPRVK